MAELIRVVVVDDNEDARGYLQRLLGFEPNMEIVGEAVDGQEAVELVREAQPHVVVMDLNMPVMDGITACEIIKHDFPATQVIIMSVQDDMQAIRQAIGNGAAAYLVKPFPPEDLVDLLARAYDAYQALSAGAESSG